jgi:hypothetical protein
MMSIEVTRQLIEEGDFEAALDNQWSLIDGGDEGARLDLAHLHDELGLHYFSQDQYLYLIENEPDFALEGAHGAIQNYVWLREYDSARDLLSQFPSLQGDLSDYVESSEANFSTLTKGAEFLEDLVSSIYADIEGVQRDFHSNLSLDNLQTKLAMEEWLMNIAIDLSNQPNSAMGNVSIEVSLAGSLGVQRPLKTLVGSEIDRARDYLKTSADAIGVLSGLPEFALRVNPIFQEACVAGKKAANKFIWLTYTQDRELNPEESQAIENICWGLQRMGDTSQGFAAFVLAGITE